MNATEVQQIQISFYIRLDF